MMNRNPPQPPHQQPADPDDEELLPERGRGLGLRMLSSDTEN
jgi:hypothetical protein